MDLTELIEHRRAGRSFQQLAEASGVTKQAWHPYIRAESHRYGSRRVPEPATIRGMVRALDVDPETIMRAIGVTIGVIPRDRQRPALFDALPPHETLELLEDADIETVVQLIHLLAGLRAEAAARAAASSASAPVPRRGARRPVVPCVAPIGA